VKPPRAARRRWAWAVALLAGATALGALAYRAHAPKPSASGKFAVGPVTHCRKVPAFAKALGYSETSVLDTLGNKKGLVLYDPPATPGGQPAHVYQHATWSSAGYLGPLTSDKSGDIYVAPAPRVNLYDNPPEKQNTVYRVDAVTGVMAEFIALPAAATPSPTNPYGVLGLAYDCDTHSLYASSVAGSTRGQEVGRIYQVDLHTGKVGSQVDGIDAFGLGIFNGSSGKRLYFGSARVSEIRSVALANDGTFSGTSRLEVALTGWGPDGDDKARRIIFDQHNVMVVRGMQFEFNLIASSERRQTDYRLRYDPGADGWTPLEVYGR
jgi:hypothetical protein